MPGKITIKFYGLLRRQVQAQTIEIEADKVSLMELLLQAEAKTRKTFLAELLDPQKKQLTGTMILVNGENVRLKQNLETRVRGGDTVDLFSPAGGG